MNQLLLRNLDPQVVVKLKNRAKVHHRSLQGEIKFILQKAVSTEVQNETGWPAHFFEKIAGGWQGETLKRPPQPEYEERDEFE